jgi:hypothetical protein
MEKDGVVAIEAEHATDNVGAWEEVEGRNATEQLRGLSHDFRVIVTAAEHPLAGGQAGELTLPANTPIPWAMPGANATVIAVAGHDAKKAVVFGVERGAKLHTGGTAVARRVSTTAPLAKVPAFGHLFDAALAWAGEATTMTSVLLLINEAERARDDREIEAHLRAKGFQVAIQLADEFKPEQGAGKIMVVPGSARIEKLEGKLRDLPAPVVLAHKTDIALDLGLTPTPVLIPGAPNAMLIRAGKWTDHLRYAIHFTQPGDYHVWLLGQSGGTAGSDEPKVFFNETPNPRSENFFEMRLEPELTWTSRATARRPENRKTPVPARVRVEQPGWHTFYLVKGSEPEHHTPEPPPSYRYPNWRVDKIVLMRAGEFRPNLDGPAETRNDGSLAVPAELLRQSEFRPAQIWRVRDGFVSLEAEQLDRDPLWVEKTEPTGFAGKSFLEWRGPGLTRTIEGLFGNNDHRHIRQGAPEWSLVVRVHLDEPGVYRLDVRNHHRMKDGDNDCWISLAGARATPDKPIVRLGDSHRDGTGFTWLDWGVPRLDLKAGLNEIRIGGRSVGFGVDRIAMYQDGNDAAKARALDPATPVSQPGYTWSALWDFVAMSEGGFAPYYADVRAPDTTRHALAIDASQHKGAFAAARTTFQGQAGRYDVTLHTLAEHDGESTYRLRVSGRVVGEFQNPPGKDQKSASHTWRGVALQGGDTVQIESNTHSNRKVPEGDAFGWSRGRWTAVTLLPSVDVSARAQ